MDVRDISPTAAEGLLSMALRDSGSTTPGNASNATASTGSVPLDRLRHKSSVKQVGVVQNVQPPGSGAV